ncbi:MAG: VacJ family lipoprotein, partial [Pseudomonadota bacterium]
MASPDAANAQTPQDPIEGFNRGVFAFNQVVDGAFLRPVALVYRAALPRVVRRKVNNVFVNLAEPVNFLNSALQGKGDDAGNAIGRFFINSTLGVGGLFDVAAALEPPYNRELVREDFGQTLGVWGWENSAYFVIPVLGPSTVRDTVGLAVDFGTVPWGFFAPAAVTVPFTATRIISAREAVLDPLDELERSSLDYYASLRTVFLQRRDFEIHDGSPPADDLFDA